MSAWLMATVLSVSARWSFEEAYDNRKDGAWYIGENNEDALLAWGESYVLSSLAAMYRATNHPMYLDRLAEHIDAVLAQRDDARGVTDYRGMSGACWRNISYQPEPYCYAVHTGMLVTPMLEFVQLVRDSPWATQADAGGETFEQKADRYLVAAQESVAVHEFEWNDAGYYRFPADAAFLPSAGNVQPLNQSNALGRAHILLASLTGDEEQLAKATALATRFQAQITAAGDGSYVWNYSGGAYAGNGEDVSHAAINMGFGHLAAKHGIVFDDADVLAFARTFTERVYVNDATFSDFVGGGTTNGASYRPQIGRWTELAPVKPTIYVAVRDAYQRDYPPESVTGGSLLLGWALLAEHEPKLCAPFFYHVDWDDQGDVREATAYGANVLTIPAALDTACLVPIEHDAPRATTVEQWDGDAYHPVARWAASAAMGIKHVPYDPTWPFVYAEGGVLFQFDDSFAAGNGIVVHEPGVLTLPTIESEPPVVAEIDVPLGYVPVAGGDEPRWWTLVDAPAHARIDPATGAIAWTPGADGEYPFVVRLDNRVGAVEQVFAVMVGGGAGTSGGDTSGDGDGDGETTAGPNADSGDASGVGEGSSGGDGAALPPGQEGVDAAGCGCRARGNGGLPVWAVAIAIALRRTRRRS